jgi:hypothetical protein
MLGTVRAVCVRQLAAICLGPVVNLALDGFLNRLFLFGVGFLFTVLLSSVDAGFCT